MVWLEGCVLGLWCGNYTNDLYQHRDEQTFMEQWTDRCRESMFFTCHFMCCVCSHVLQSCTVTAKNIYTSKQCYHYCHICHFSVLTYNLHDDLMYCSLVYQSTFEWDLRKSPEVQQSFENFSWLLLFYSSVHICVF